MQLEGYVKYMLKLCDPHNCLWALFYTSVLQTLCNSLKDPTGT